MSGIDSEGLHRVEFIAAQEVKMIESSGIRDELAEAQNEWLYDPVDAQAEEVRLRSLLGAIETMEQ